MRRDGDDQAGRADGTARPSWAVVALPTAPGEFALRLPARVDVVAEVRQRLRAWLHVHYVHPDLVSDVVLAASELIGNSAEHAFAPDTPGEVRFSARLADGLLVLRVADTGTWQPPRRGPSSRGRGLIIVRAVADSVEIDHTGSGTLITAVFTVRPGSA